MDRIEELKLEKFRLYDCLDEFLEHLEEGNSDKLLMLSKKVIDDISRYLKLEDILLSGYSNSEVSISFCSSIREQHTEIHCLFADLYTIHVTEPDGEFAKIMIDIVTRGRRRLDEFYKFLQHDKMSQEIHDFSPYFTNVTKPSVSVTHAS